MKWFVAFICLLAVQADVIDLGSGHVFNPYFFHATYEPSTVLPEIIVNRARPLDPRSNRGYNYPRPTNPPPHDEPVANDYLPPYQPAPTEQAPPPPRDVPEPENSYLPTEFRSAKDLDFFKSNVNSLTGMKVELRDLKCLQSPNGYFKAQLYIHNNIDTVPVIEQDVGDPRCEIRALKSQSFINIVSEDFTRCGIYSCGAELCLKLRFPQIRGLKTGNDLSLTLQCKLPERVVAKTHSIRVGVSNGITPRAAGSVAHGGGQQPFHSQIGLFRKNTESQFTRPLHSGESVQLGEEVMLRAQVRVGDGWNHTKLSDIVLQRYTPEGELLNSVNLVNAGGCVNPLMKNVCPLEPILDAPLGYKFGFKVFMFQGMKSGDELVMNVKLAGCLFKKDCQLDCDSQRSSRVTRNAAVALFPLSPQPTTVAAASPPSEIAHLSFRVEAPHAADDDTVGGVDNSSSSSSSSFINSLNPYQRFTLVVATSVICFVGGVFLLIVHLIMQQQKKRTQRTHIYNSS